MIPKETVDLILDTARVEEVIGDFVTLKRRGSSYVACCPFHNEKTPSFHVTPAKGIYKCFGCGKAGSAVGFVMEYEHMTYPEALRYLAKKYNIEVQEEEETAEQIAARQRSESLLAVSEFARKFFCDQLKDGEGRAVGYQYYRKRNILDTTIEKWSLGWAPSGKTTLAAQLSRIYDCTVFHMDDFFLRPQQRTPQRLAEPGGNVDRERFYEEVLRPLTRRPPLQYQRYDCHSQTLEPPVELIPKPLTIVEGAYSLHPALADCYDLSVFLRITPELQRQRILKRNGPEGAEQFFSRWVPLEEAYFKATDPASRCDLILEVLP